MIKTRQEVRSKFKVRSKCTTPHLQKGELYLKGREAALKCFHQ